VNVIVGGTINKFFILVQTGVFHIMNAMLFVLIFVVNVLNVVSRVISGKFLF